MGNRAFYAKELLNISIFLDDLARKFMERGKERSKTRIERCLHPNSSHYKETVS